MRRNRKLALAARANSLQRLLGAALLCPMPTRSIDLGASSCLRKKGGFGVGMRQVALRNLQCRESHQEWSRLRLRVASNDRRCGAANFMSERDDLSCFGLLAFGVGPSRRRGMSVRPHSLPLDGGHDCGEFSTSYYLPS